MNQPVESARDVLAKHAKTFSFASSFLGEERTGKAARLYRFCRVVDDIADEGDCPDTARNQLNLIRNDLKLGSSNNLITKDFLALAAECNLEIQAAHDLLEGVISDLNPVAIQDDAALDHYCYQVAGTVGLMMSPILGTHDQDALKYACDLGKAMQLTNICRDIQEDALRGRVYVPKTLTSFDVTKHLNQQNEAVARACQVMLLRADELYTKAEFGLAYLPLRSKLCILIASRLYKAIGVKLLKKECAYWEGRVFTTRFEKIMTTSYALITLWLRPKFWLKTPYAEN